MLGKLLLKVNHVEGLTYCLNRVIEYLEFVPKELQDSLLAIECVSRELKRRVIEIRKDLNKLV